MATTATYPPTLYEVSDLLSPVKHMPIAAMIQQIASKGVVRSSTPFLPSFSMYSTATTEPKKFAPARGMFRTRELSPSSNPGISTPAFYIIEGP